MNLLGKIEEGETNSDEGDDNTLLRKRILRSTSKVVLNFEKWLRRRPGGNTVS